MKSLKRKRRGKKQKKKNEHASQKKHALSSHSHPALWMYLQESISDTNEKTAYEGSEYTQERIGKNNCLFLYIV